jgi:uncharacterized RDD family membrane protein YckC
MFGVDSRTEEPSVPAGLVLAPISRRVGGLVIDELIVLVPIVLVALASGLQPGTSIDDSTVFVMSIASAAASFVYYTVMVAKFGRTVGKIAVGTRVVRADDGGAVDWTASTLRALVPLAAGVVPSVGFGLTIGVYSFAIFSPLRQGLHDRAGGTLVVLRTPPSPTPPTSPPTSPPPSSWPPS